MPSERGLRCFPLLFVALVSLSVTAASCGRSDLFSGRRDGGGGGAGFGGRGGSGGGVGGSGNGGADGGLDGAGGDPSGDGGGCPATARESCDNGVDDDCNRRIDCADPACFGDRACFVVGQEICNNGLDDDDDRLVDCADGDCVTSLACRPTMGRETCDNGVDDNADQLVDCSDPQCVSFPGCLAVSCHADVEFGALAARDARATRTLDTTDGQPGFSTCAPAGGHGRVGRFTLATAADVRMDFSQPTGAAHVVSLFRAGIGQACDQNLVTCVRAGQDSATTRTFQALPAGTYWLIVQAFPNTEGATTVTLSTGATAAPEICNNGADDDSNGLTDCQDLACRATPSCASTECTPDVNVGTLVVDGAARSAIVDTSSGGNRFHPTCAGTSQAGDRTVSFSLAEAGGVLVEYVQRGGQHAFGLFQMPTPGLACDASQLDCVVQTRNSSSFAMSNVAAGRYLLIIKATSAPGAGRVDLRISAFKNRRIEICGNGFDDDNNGLGDCDDPACFGVGACTESSCTPDADLGPLRAGAQREITLDVRAGRDLYQTSCGRGNGRERIVRLTLAEPMGLGIACTQNGSHVFQLSQQVAPLDACNQHQVSCVDPEVIPFGCSYIVPGLQPGQYNLIVEGFQAGTEGTVALTLTGEREALREVCGNDVDDDGDGAVDCADRKCVTSPLCARFACRADRTLGPLALDGNPNAVALQTSMGGDDQAVACAAAAGGQDAVVDFQLPARADVTVEWAQVGAHAIALYADDGALLACDAGRQVACLAATGQPTGRQVLTSLPAGRYHLVVDADRAGSEGGVVIQLSGVLSP